MFWGLELIGLMGFMGLGSMRARRCGTTNHNLVNPRLNSPPAPRVGAGRGPAPGISAHHFEAEDERSTASQGNLRFSVR